MKWKSNIIQQLSLASFLGNSNSIGVTQKHNELETFCVRHVQLPAYRLYLSGPRKVLQFL
jgi:hypothetical protein